MKILGINFSLDSAAALVVDGHVVGAVAEERFTRRKHEGAFPARAIAWCLAEGGLTLADIDRVAFFWNPGIHAEPSNWRLTEIPRHHLEYLYALPVHLMRHFDGRGVERVDQTLWLEGGHPLKMHFITHHHCHAAGTFFASGFESAAILTVDGYGERAATQIATARGQTITPITQIDFPHSVGSLYAAFTQYLGFRANNGEGKVMGLASYGEPTYYEKLRDLVTLSPEGFELDLSMFSFYLERRRRYSDKLVALLGPERAREGPLEQRHMDIAASLQQLTEEILLHLAKLAKRLTGERHLCMAGGVTLNCVANSRIRFEAGFEDVHFMPASGDAGTSVGAALYAAHVLGDDVPVPHLATDARGPRFADEEIREALERACVSFETPNDICATTASLLAEGKIVGWFQGRAELGPRALGRRSILADPRDPGMKDRLNDKVKFREAFRPFAPSVLAERCGEYFEHDVPSPYMLLVYATRDDQQSTLPAITHVDGTARVQTVHADASPLYHKLISAFDDLTGVPVVLNTSFNIRGEPIVNTVADALKCYFTTGMDALAIGPYLLTKSEDP